MDRYDKSGARGVDLRDNRNRKKSNAIEDGYDVLDTALLDKCVARWKND